MVLGACADSPGAGESTATTGQTIVSGTEDDADPAVVGLISGADSFPSCTGTLIGPRVIVTAAHCIADGRKRVVRFGATVISVKDVHAHPRFDRGTLSYDIATVELDRDAPSDVVPIVLAAAPPPVGSHLRVVGFGLAHALDFPTELRKRSGGVAVDALRELDFRVVPAESMPCSGDSGGAAFADDGSLVGVVSNGDRACATYAELERVDVHASFLEDAIAQGRAHAAPAGASCAMRSVAPGSRGVQLSAIVALTALLSLSRRRRRPRSPVRADFDLTRRV
jgi:secreted trypsin-like serine protease